MTPHGPEPVQRSNPETDAALREALAELRLPMTVILGRAQLLQRRIRAGTVTTSEDCLEALASIEMALHALEAKLRALEQTGDA